MPSKPQLVRVYETASPNGRRRIYDGGAPDLMYVEYVSGPRAATNPPKPHPSDRKWPWAALAFLLDKLVQVAISMLTGA